MRILFATYHAHLPQCTGGMEVNTDALAAALQAQGHSVEVFCGFEGPKLGGKLWRLAHQAARKTLMTDRLCGYPVHRTPAPDQAVAQILARAQPDVVITQGWKAHELAIPFLRAGLPTLIYVHTADRFAFGPELAAAPGLRFAVNSRFSASLHPDKRIDAVLPPLIRPEAYRVSSRRQTVLFVNPAPSKGLSIAVRLATGRPDVAFDFYEAWTLGAEDRLAARRLTAALPNVRWRSAVRDMRRAYRQARLVLFPSAMETWGRVASEAHISGVPTLGSDRGALPETIGPAGLCVPFEADAADWMAAFNSIWDDEAAYARYSQAALEFSRRPQVSPAIIVGTLADLLRSMTDSAASLRASPTWSGLADKADGWAPRSPSLRPQPGRGDRDHRAGVTQ